MAATDLGPLIGTEAGNPSSSSTDGQSASARPIGDLIAADQYTNTKAAIPNTRRRGIYFNKIVTPGALSDCGGRDAGIGWFEGGRQ